MSVVDPAAGSTPLVGFIVVIKKSGRDGPKFPLQQAQTVIGRHLQCDIRIQLPHVSKQHAKITVDENRQIGLEHLSASGQTLVNNISVPSRALLLHGDVFTIADRSFRIEYIETEVPKLFDMSVLEPIQESTPLKAVSQNALRTPQPATPASRTTRRTSIAKTPIGVPHPAPITAAHAITTISELEEAPASTPMKTTRAALATPLRSSIAAAAATGFVKPVAPAQSMPTPMRRALLSRQKEITSKAAPAAIKVLATPLKKAILKGAALKSVNTATETEQEAEAETEVPSVIEPAADASAPTEEPVVPASPARSTRRSTRQSLAAVQPVIPEETEEADVQMQIDPIAEDEPVEEPTVTRETTVRLESILTHETEAVIPAAEPRHPRRAMATPMKAGIIAKQSELVKPKEPTKSLPTPLKSAISKVQPVEKPAMAVMPTPMKRALRGGRDQLKPYFEPVSIEVGEVEVPAAVGALVATADAAPRGRRSMRVAASESDVAVAAVGMATPLKSSLAQAAADVAESRQQKQAKKVLPTPLKAAIKSVQPVAKPQVQTMPTPIKKAIRGGRAQLKSVPVQETITDVEEEEEVDADAEEPETADAEPAEAEAVEGAEAEVEAEADAEEDAEVEAEAVADDAEAEVADAEVEAEESAEATEEADAEVVDADVEMEEDGNAVEIQLDFDEAADEEEDDEEDEVVLLRDPTLNLESLLTHEVESDIPAAEPRHPRRAMATPIKAGIIAKQGELVKAKEPAKSLPTPLKKAIKKVQPVEKPKLAVMPTPMKRALRGGRANLKPVPEPEAAEEEEEEAAEAEVEVEADAEADAVPESTEVEVEVDAEAEPDVPEAPTPRGRRSLRNAAAAPAMSTPLKQSLVAAAATVADSRQQKQPKKVLSTPLKSAINQMQPAAKPTAKTMPTPMKKAIRGGRAQLKAVPAAEENSLEEEDAEDEEAEQDAPAAAAAEAAEAEPEVVSETAEAVADAPEVIAEPTVADEAAEPIVTEPESVEEPTADVAAAAESAEEVSAEAEPATEQSDAAAEQVESTPAAEETSKADATVVEADADAEIDSQVPSPVVVEPTETSAEPAAEAIAEPVAEFVAEPVVEPVAEPEAVAEPIAEKTVEVPSAVQDIASVEAAESSPVDAEVLPQAEAVEVAVEAEPESVPEVESKPVEKESTPVTDALQEEQSEPAAAIEEVSASEEEVAPASVAAPAPVPVQRAPIRLAPVSRKLARRRAGVVMSRTTKPIARGRNSALAHATEKARTSAKAALPAKQVAQAEASQNIIESIESILTSPSHQLDQQTRDLVQPIYEQLIGIKNDAIACFSPLPVVARGCHSSVVTPSTPAPAARLSIGRRSSFMGTPFGGALGAPTPFTPFSPSFFSGERTLAQNLVALLASPRDALPPNTRDSIDGIFEDLIGVDLDLTTASEEDIAAEAEREPILFPEEPEAEAGAEATPVKSQQVTPARRLPTPLRAGIVATARGFVNHVTKQSMATPLRRAILARQRELASQVAPVPVKVLATPLKKAILKGAALKPVPVESVTEETEAELAPEAEVNETDVTGPVGLSLFDGLEALEEAMYACVDSASPEVEPISCDLQQAADEPDVAPSPVRAVRRASRKSFNLPLAIPEGTEASTEDAAATAQAAPAPELSAAAELLHSAVMHGVEEMIRAQVAVEHAIEQAENEAIAVVEAEEEERAEAETVPEEREEEETPVAAPAAKKGKKKASAKRRLSSVADETDEVVEAAESSPKKQKTVDADEECEAAPASSKKSKAASKRRTAKRKAEEETETESVAEAESEAPKARKTRRKAATVVVEEVATAAEEEDEEVVAPASKKKGTRAQLAVPVSATRTSARKRKNVEESESESVAAVEEEAPTKRVRATRKKAVAAADEESAAEDAPVSAVKKSTRSRRGAAAAEDHTDAEDAAPTSAVRSSSRRKAAAVVSEAEDDTTSVRSGRSTRTRK